MPSSVAPLIGRARLSCVVAAITTVLCAGLMTAAVVVPAPLAALPVLIPVCFGLPVLAALDVPNAVVVLVAARRTGVSGRRPNGLRRDTPSGAAWRSSHPAELPPRDPYEPGAEPDGTEPLPAATVIFPFGAADEETDRLASRFLDWRPGLLIVVHRP